MSRILLDDLLASSTCCEHGNNLQQHFARDVRCSECPRTVFAILEHNLGLNSHGSLHLDILMHQQHGVGGFRAISGSPVRVLLPLHFRYVIVSSIRIVVPSPSLWKVVRIHSRQQLAYPLEVAERNLAVYIVNQIAVRLGRTLRLTALLTEFPCEIRRGRAKQTRAIH